MMLSDWAAAPFVHFIHLHSRPSGCVLVQRLDLVASMVIPLQLLLAVAKVFYTPRSLVGLVLWLSVLVVGSAFWYLLETLHCR